MKKVSIHIEILLNHSSSVSSSMVDHSLCYCTIVRAEISMNSSALFRKSLPDAFAGKAKSNAVPCPYYRIYITQCH